MRNNKGLTLIEVILSLALLGLLAMLFIPKLTSYFSWMDKTKTDITQKAFISQEVMEMNINNIKETLNKEESLMDGSNYKYDIVEKINEIKLFENEFKDSERQYPNAYQVEVPLGGNKKYVTLVGDRRLPELPVPIIIAEDLLIQRGSQDTTDKYEYGDIDSFKLKGIANMTQNPGNSFNRYRIDWYISNPGFIMPVPSKEFINQDYDMGRIYPSFPNDYVPAPIHSELGSSFTYQDDNNRIINFYLSNDKIKNYPGKHILYTITPFSKALKAGIVTNSMPIYIYNPVYNNNLILHLDASTIDKNGYNQDEYSVGVWKNNRPNTMNLDNNIGKAEGVQGFPIPRLMTVDVGNVYTTPEIPFQRDLDLDNTDDGKVWGRALGNEKTTEEIPEEDRISKISRMKIKDMSLGNQWSTFIIMRVVDNPFSPVDDVSIIEGSEVEEIGNPTWSIAWVNDELGLKLAFKDGNDNEVKLSSSLNENHWYMIRVTVNDDIVDLNAINLQSGINNVLTGNGNIENLNNNYININWNGVEIAEILIYSDDITSQLSTITKYLKDKYNPQ